MARRQFWQVPGLHDDEEHHKHRPVTWIELFLDLFVVVAVAQLAHPLHEAHSWSEVGMFFPQFGLLLWVWVGLTYYQERFETEGLENRVILFALMLGISGMAAYAHDGLGHNWRGYVGSYCACRAFTVLLWIRAGYHVKAFRPVAVRYAIVFGIGQSLAFASLFAAEADRTWMLACAILCEVAGPLTILTITKKLPRLSSSKHPERFGLFTLIVLGEAVAGVVSGLADQHDPGGAELGRVLLALAVGFGMWWIYFDFVGRRPFKPNPVLSFIWVYLHFATFATIVVGGIALSANVAGHPHEFTQELLGIAMGMFLAITGGLETVLARKDDEPTHPVVSPLLKLGLAPVAIVSGFVVGGGWQLAWIFATFAVPMGYGLFVWFTQELPPPHAEAHH